MRLWPATKLSDFQRVCMGGNRTHSMPARANRPKRLWLLGIALPNFGGEGLSLTPWPSPSLALFWAGNPIENRPASPGSQCPNRLDFYSTFSSFARHSFTRRRVFFFSLLFLSLFLLFKCFVRFSYGLSRDAGLKDRKSVV